MSDRKLVKLDLSALTITTEVIESELLALGIRVVRMEIGGHSVYPTGPMEWIDLYVPEEQLEESLAILDKLAQVEKLPEDQVPHIPADEIDESGEDQG